MDQCRIRGISAVPSEQETTETRTIKLFRPISLTERQIERFWELVEKTESGCWLWKGATQLSNGVLYGRFANLFAHRIAYTLQVGPIPDGLTIDHLRESKVCTSTLCMNAAHMEPVTRAENSRRMQAPKLKPTCKWGHIRETNKPCKACAVMHVKLYATRHPEKAREMARNQKRKERARKKAELQLVAASPEARP